MALLLLLRGIEMPKLKVSLIVFLLIPSVLFSQVDEIKRASSNRSSSGSASASGGSGGGDHSFAGDLAGDLFINFMFAGVVKAQQQRLGQKRDIPTTVSLDLLLQGAAQPSAYYILQPRIRGTWALFSTDFRINYLIEEDIEGPRHIRTNDWQALQLNLLNTRHVLLRLGGGVMQEAFGQDQSFPEWTAGFHFQPVISKYSGVAEYRSAEVRKEVSLFGQYRVFDRGYFHGFATAGCVYQKYYDNITTWGMQAGFVFKLY